MTPSFKGRRPDAVGSAPSTPWPRGHGQDGSLRTSRATTEGSLRTMPSLGETAGIRRAEIHSRFCEKAEKLAEKQEALPD